jgi:hypothetical protein
MTCDPRQCGRLASVPSAVCLRGRRPVAFPVALANCLRVSPLGSHYDDTKEEIDDLEAALVNLTLALSRNA